MTAAYFNHIQVFEALLVAGADFNEIVEVSDTYAIFIPARQHQNFFDLTPTFTAIQWGFVSNALLVAADRGNLEIVNMLLERECKIESTDQVCNGPVFASCIFQLSTILLNVHT